MEARRWLKGRYEEAGLDVTIDGVGNVLGKSRNPGRALLVGSHSDTQPTGGWLDGALGVIYGLETVRALAEDPETKDFAVDAISWQDEESRFFGCLGSSSFCGLPTPQPGDGATDKDGVLLDDAVRQAGLAEAPRLVVDKARYIGFIEAHIEQGPHLEDAGNFIGVVNSIVGLRGTVFHFTGQQNHAGTTMMAGRRDAATALYALANAINEEFPKVAGRRSVWTMGRAHIHPGAPSIVPGHAELELQFRDISNDVLDAMEALVERLVAKINDRGGAVVEAQPSRVQINPAHMDEGFRAHFGRAAEKHAPGKWVDMPSGAFHDAGIVCSALPSGLMFIPSIGGISHDFSEDSHEQDIALGCAVFADAVASIVESGG
jgi:N-carbamoyl-L-amino-acid hydrolase